MPYDMNDVWHEPTSEECAHGSMIPVGTDCDCEYCSDCGLSECICDDDIEPDEYESEGMSPSCTCATCRRDRGEASRADDAYLEYGHTQGLSFHNDNGTIDADDKGSWDNSYFGIEIEAEGPRGQRGPGVRMINQSMPHHLIDVKSDGSLI